MRNYIIKLLGGYTKKEMERQKNKYQALLDSKTTDTVARIVNEYVERTLKDLYVYAKTLYGSSLWADKMYNVLKNNWLRIRVRYIDAKSNSYYKIDTTLDGENQFANILKEEHYDKYWILETD